MTIPSLGTIFGQILLNHKEKSTRLANTAKVNTVSQQLIEAIGVPVSNF